MTEQIRKTNIENNDRSRLERIAKTATKYIGSPISLVIHTIFFIGIFSLQWTGMSFEQIMLILTTVVSLEAIYLSIFIQMTVNLQAAQIEEVSEDVDDIQENVEEISKGVEEIQEDVEEISEDMEEIQEDMEEISKDVEEISEDVEEISKDVDSISEDVEEIQEDVETIQEDAKEISEDVGDILEYHDEPSEKDKITKIERTLEMLLAEIQSLKK